VNFGALWVAFLTVSAACYLYAETDAKAEAKICIGGGRPLLFPFSPFPSPWGLRWGSLQRSPRPSIAGGEGAGCLPPKNLTSALGPSGLDPLGLNTRPIGPQ